MVVDRRGALRCGLTALIGAFATSACATDRERITAPPFGAPAPIVPGAGPPANADEIRSVAMIGDSITVGAREPLTRMFAAADLQVIALDAENGRRIAVGSGAVASGIDVAGVVAAASPAPDLWVVALGTNDVQQYSPDEFASLVSELLAEIPGGAPVVWVDVHIDQAVDVCARFNTALSTALGARGGAVVAPWSAIAPTDGALSDGIHPTNTGTQLFADVVAASVAVATGR